MARGLTPGLNPTAAGLRPLPGHSGTPGLGFVGRYFSDQLGWARDTYDRHGPISWTKGLGQPIFVALGPEATGVVLTNSDKAFANGPGWDFLIGPFFKRGIMLLDFAEHLYHRRIMQQAFTRDRLNTYLVAMNPGIAHGLNTWAPGPSFTLYPAIKRLTLDLAAQTFLGGDLGADTQRINKAFVASVQGGEAYLRFPVPGLTWSRGLAGRRYLEGRFRAQLPAKRASDVSTNADLFSALCHAVSENGERFTDDDVVNHIIFLMLAAHDTTTTTLATMAYYLAKHPDWQRRAPLHRARHEGSPAAQRTRAAPGAQNRQGHRSARSRRPGRHVHPRPAALRAPHARVLARPRAVRP